MKDRVAPSKKIRTPNDSVLKYLFLTPITLWLGCLFVLPLLFLLWIGFWRVENYQAVMGFSFQNYGEIFSSLFTRSRYGLAMLQSLYVAFTTTIIAVGFSYLVALAIAFCVPERWQRLTLLFAIAPFWSSYVLRLYSWQTILSTNGVINSVLKQIGLEGVQISVIYTQIATRIGLVHYLAPILIVILYVSILSIDKVLIEAARELGATRWKAFTRVIFPLSKFGIMTSASFAMIVCLGDALSGNLLGGGAGLSILGKLPTYASMIMSDYSSSTNLPRTSALATILIVVMIIALVGGTILANRARSKS